MCKCICNCNCNCFYEYSISASLCTLYLSVSSFNSIYAVFVNDFAIRTALLISFFQLYLQLFLCICLLTHTYVCIGICNTTLNYIHNSFHIFTPTSIFVLCILYLWICSLLKGPSHVMLAENTFQISVRLIWHNGNATGRHTGWLVAAHPVPV